MAKINVTYKLQLSKLNNNEIVTGFDLFFKTTKSSFKFQINLLNDDFDVFENLKEFVTKNITKCILLKTEIATQSISCDLNNNLRFCTNFNQQLGGLHDVEYVVQCDKLKEYLKTIILNIEKINNKNKKTNLTCQN